MLGAITGDVIGSVYEGWRIKRKDFRLFPWLAMYTDDTVLTVAVADALLRGEPVAYGPVLKAYARRRPLRGYGPKFSLWLLIPGRGPYYSLGNGSAMRVSPVAYARNTAAEVLAEAERSAACTHNHPEGIKGAQAVALAIWLARQGASKPQIQAEVSALTGYDLATPLSQIRPGYRLNLTCPGSVPQAIRAFLESTDFEDAIRNAVSLGGDADTQAAIAGAIAEAFYGGVPEALLQQVWPRLPRSYQQVISRFYRHYAVPGVLPG